MYFTEEAVPGWHPPKTGSRGSPRKYLALAIETSLMVRQEFRLPLRQTQGFINSLVTALGIGISNPDFSCLSKRSISLPRHKLTKGLEAGSIIIVDSTGLKVYGTDEWNQEKHAVAARRTWRKLHFAVDENHQLLACELTTPETGDPTAVPDFLYQIDTPFDTFIADGAYDGDPVSNAVLNQEPDAQVVVQPYKTAVCSAASNSQRDSHIQTIGQVGRIAWQKKTGKEYRKRNASGAVYDDPRVAVGPGVLSESER